MAPNTPQKPQVSAGLVDPQDRPRGEALTQWLGREGKVAAGLTAHFKTVILDPTVSVIATAVCRTHWGRQRFQIGHFDDLCGAKVRQVKNESQQTQREHEGSRFQQPLWYELLESVINWFGADKFKGIMAYYRKEGRLENTAVQKETLEQVVSDKFRKLRRHTDAVPGLHKSDT